MRKFAAIMAAGVAVTLGGCATTPTTSEQLVADPFEPANRAIFAFNSGVDRVVIEPASEVYGAVVPRFGRNRIRDFVDNLKTPVWFVNEVLQGDFAGAGRQATRFFFNSTLGVAGLYDIAANVGGIEKEDEDFGQTLAVWGVENGPYIVLPILGPTTARDLAGRGVDVAFDPLTWSEFEGDDTLRVTTGVLDGIDIRHRADDAIELTRESLDPYVQTRTLYIQSRNRRISENEIENLPDFEEYPDFE